MKLVEHEGKKLLKQFGIAVPDSILVNNKDYVSLSYGKEKYHHFYQEHGGAVIKAQVLGGGRKKSGLVFVATDYDSSLPQIAEIYNKNHDGWPIDTLLIEERLEIKQEYFLSVLYDTRERRPVIIFSDQGGIEIESNSEAIKKIYPKQVTSLDINEALSLTDNQALAELIVAAYNCFIAKDCTHLEINPIILTLDDKLFAGDAKITIDDSALPRQEEFTGLNEGVNFSDLELRARKIDQADHRGVAGKTFVELDGDIAVLASGGGASLTSLDALIEAGGAPANYTEYSGNPSGDKVRQLTEVTLSKAGLNGCLVIGGTANFTDIFETLSGFVAGLKNLPALPAYPIVIRRAGPRDQEAFVMLKDFAEQNNLDVTLFGADTPMSYAAKVMAEKVNEYKAKKLQATS